MSKVTPTSAAKPSPVLPEESGTPKDPSGSAPPRRAYRIREVSELLGIPKSTVYDLVTRGEIRSVRMGKGCRKIILIPASEIDRLLEPVQGSRTA